MLDNLLKDYFVSEDWLEDFIENAHDLIHVLHPDGRILYVNKAWTNLLKYSKEEILGNSIYSFIAEADISRYRDYRTAVINGVVSNKEIAFGLKTKTNEIIIVEGIVSTYVKDGSILFTRGFFRDVTARVQYEAQLERVNNELKERENNLQQLLMNAPDAVIVINENSEITFWNPKAEEVFGWRAEEVIHKLLSATIIPLQHRQAHEAGMKRYLATGKAQVLNTTIEIEALKKSGEEFFISLTISRTLQNGKLAFISFIRDITEQKNNQLELERKTLDLEHSNTNLEEFAFAASHDLKEPIRKILTFSDRLKSRLNNKLEEEDLRLFERMESSGKRMASLVDDLLTYSQVSTDKTSVETLDLNIEISMVLEDLELEIQEKAAILFIAPLPTIKAHKRQVHQLFQNLIGNSIKYGKPTTPPHININSVLINGKDSGFRLNSEDGNKKYHLIQVKDNGVGFNQLDAERIFNVFTRLHGNTEYKGTGVGLSIVRKVMENHNGYVWAEGKEGVGATFKLLFPAE